MDKTEFYNEIDKAKEFKRMGDRPTYWDGFILGLERQVRGVEAVSDDDHDMWMSVSEDEPDLRRRLKGQGYKEGYNK